MLDFFRLMLPVTLLRRGPDRMPYSPSLLVLAVTACALPTLLAATLAEQALSLSVLRFAIAAAVYSGAVALLLHLYGFGNRLVQTLTAAFGAGAVFGLVDLGLVVSAGIGIDESIVRAAALALQIWALVVDGFILSVALGISLALGCLLAFSILLPQLALIMSVGAGPASGTG